MFSEAFQTVPRKDRPSVEELENYVRRSEPDLDYSAYRRESWDWLTDYRREEEEKREQQASGRQRLPGHETNEYLVNGGRRGFNPDDFDMDEIVRVVKSRPQH